MLGWTGWPAPLPVCLTHGQASCHPVRPTRAVCGAAKCSSKIFFAHSPIKPKQVVTVSSTSSKCLLTKLHVL